MYLVCLRERASYSTPLQAPSISFIPLTSFPDHCANSSNMSRPMNDDEVLSEMKKMVSFIKQEAMEKAREIQVKADEEFAIEKVSRKGEGRG
jgi:hypothetical protein